MAGNICSSLKYNRQSCSKVCTEELALATNSKGLYLHLCGSRQNNCLTYAELWKAAKTKKGSCWGSSKGICFFMMDDWLIRWECSRWVGFSIVIVVVIRKVSKSKNTGYRLHLEQTTTCCVGWNSLQLCYREEERVAVQCNQCAGIPLGCCEWAWGTDAVIMHCSGRVSNLPTGHRNGPFPIFI